MNPSSPSVSIPAPAEPIRATLGFQALLSTSSAIGPIFLRLTVAAVMFPHGAQKLLGWFGGYGFEGTMQFFTVQMGIPYLLALGAILVEFFTPLLLVFGLATRASAIAMAIVMAVAMVMVQWQYGFFMNWYGQQEGEGIQFTVLLLGALTALIVSGGGALSLDRSIMRASGSAQVSR